MTDIDGATAGLVVLVAATVGVTWAARRLGLAAPIVLVAIGAVVAFLPWGPHVEVEPDLVLTVLLPPLLFAATAQLSIREVRARRVAIVLLSVGLVAFTVVAVGVLTWVLVPTLSLAAALAFGAVVAPTDAVAVTAVTRRARLPRVLSTLLEGESLLNDATALVALNTAVLAITTTVLPGQVALSFAVAVVGGIAVGLAVGWVVGAVRSRLVSPVLDTSVSLLTPFLAFLPAHAVGASGPLAVVAAGLLLGYRAPVVQSAEARVAETVNWRTIRFLLENGVFLLIGLSVPAVLEGAARAGIGTGRAVLTALLVVGAVVVSRLVWSLAVTAVFRWGPAALRRRSWPWRLNLAVTAAGARGVVTLAAVLLLPESTPDRGLVQLLALAVVIGTLLVAMALPAVIRLSALPAPDDAAELGELEGLLSEARAAGLRRLDTAEGLEERAVLQVRENAAFLDGDPGTTATERAAAFARARILALGAERDAVVRARGEDRYDERAVRRVLAAIDAEEAALWASVRDVEE